MAEGVTLSSAQDVVEGARKKAEEIGVPMNIAVVDAGNNLSAFARMDGAWLGSIDIAMKKARTAALFQTNSEAVWEYCKPGAPAHALELTNDGLAPFGGGIPLRSTDGEVLGAVGVSGSAVAQDLEIAQVAAAAFPTESIHA